MTREQLLPLVVTPGKDLNNRFGYYHHADWIGIPYGSKVGSRNGKGFIHLLRPTPELWTLALPHRTQILYAADIAFVTSWLNIRPGSKVIEAGTGSGSFSHSTARTIGPQGHLYSYEFHEARATKAREEFERHGMTNVTLTHRNVCKDGFTVTDTVDAVFLDLPAPWEAVEHAKRAMRKDRMTRICCFSPCIEQVLRTVNALNEHGFSDVTTYETLLRPHDISAPTPAKTIGEVAERLRITEIKREEKRQIQIANSRARQASMVSQTGPSGEKRKRPDATVDEMEGVEQQLQGEAEEGLEPKRPRTDTTSVKFENDEEDTPAEFSSSGAAVTSASINDVSNTLATAVSHSGVSSSTSKLELGSLDSDPAASSRPRKRDHVLPAGELPARRATVSKVFAEVRGHTSYLTFAVLFPATYDLVIGHEDGTVAETQQPASME